MPLLTFEEDHILGKKGTRSPVHTADKDVLASHPLDINLVSFLEGQGAGFPDERAARLFGDCHYPVLFDWLHTCASMTLQVFYEG